MSFVICPAPTPKTGRPLNERDEGKEKIIETKIEL